MRLLLALLATAAIVAPAAQAQDSVSVSIGRFVEFVDSDTVQAQVTVTCEGTILESFAYVVQRDRNSDFGFFGPICDGVTRTYAVTIQAAEGETFRRGRARVSTLVLLESGPSDSPSRKVVIR
jgi:hypothetical protein